MITVGDAAGSIWELAATNGQVYWESIGSGVYAADGTIGVLDRCTGKGTTIATGQAAPYGLAADASGVCWTSLGSTVGGTYQNDGAVTCDGIVIAQAQPGPFGVALLGGAVLWANDGAYGPVTIERAPRTGGGVATIFTANFGSEGEPIATDGQLIFLAGTGGSIVSVSNGTSTTLATGGWDIRSIVVDDTNVYFDDFAGGSVISVPKVGGASTQLANEGSITNQLAADSRYVYFASTAGVGRIAKSGGAVEMLTTQPADEYALAADGMYVYFTQGGFVLRVRSP